MCRLAEGPSALASLKLGLTQGWANTHLNGCFAAVDNAPQLPAMTVDVQILAAYGVVAG